MTNARQYYRVMLGRGSKHAKLCHDGEFIGGDWQIRTDLRELLKSDVRSFNKHITLRPIPASRR